jgi:hypothetical protein
MLREYDLYPWHFGGPEEMYPSETDAVIRDVREVQEAQQKAAQASSARRGKAARRG